MVMMMVMLMMMMMLQNGFSEKFEKFMKNTYDGIFVLLKKGSSHSCFPLTFAKYFKVAASIMEIGM